MVYISQKGGGGLSNSVSFHLRTTCFRIGSNIVPVVIAEFGILCCTQYVGVLESPSPVTR